MTEWNEQTLSSICDILMGQSPEGSSCNKIGDGIPLLNGPTEFGTQHPFPVQYTTGPKKLSQTGDILFCVRGSTTGRMNYADQPYAIGRGLAAFRHKKGVKYQPYLKAVIEFLLPTLLRDVTGSTFPNLSGDQLRNIKFRMPTWDIQLRISEVLSSLDDKIELNRQMSQTLEEMAQAVFKHHFVDGIDEDNLPEGWRTGSLGEVVNIKGGTTPSTTVKEYWDGEINWTSPRDLANNKSPFLTTTEKRITEFGLSKISSGLLPVNTVLLSSRAPIGYIAISDIPVAINQGYIAILPDSTFSTYYMHFWLKENMDLIEQNANGSTFMEISKGVFRQLPTVIPSSDDITAFTEKVSSLFDMIRSNTHETEYLIETRDYLLPKLISGEVVPADLKRLEQAL